MVHTRLPCFQLHFLACRTRHYTSPTLTRRPSFSLSLSWSHFTLLRLVDLLTGFVLLSRSIGCQSVLSPVLCSGIYVPKLVIGVLSSFEPPLWANSKSAERPGT